MRGRRHPRSQWAPRWPQQRRGRSSGAGARRTTASAAPMVARADIALLTRMSTECVPSRLRKSDFQSVARADIAPSTGRGSLTSASAARPPAPPRARVFTIACPLCRGTGRGGKHVLVRQPGREAARRLSIAPRPAELRRLPTSWGPPLRRRKQTHIPCSALRAPRPPAILEQPYKRALCAAAGNRTTPPSWLLCLRGEAEEGGREREHTGFNKRYSVSG